MWSLSKMHQVGELTAAAAVVVSLLRIWRGFEVTFQEVLQLPGVRQWLANRIHWFSNEFQLYLHDDAMHQSSPADPVIYDDPACSANNGA